MTAEGICATYIVFSLFALSFAYLDLKKKIRKQKNAMLIKDKFTAIMLEKNKTFSDSLRQMCILAENENADEAVSDIKKYIDDVIEKKEKEKKRVFYVGDSILSTYLFEKKQEALKYGINLDINVIKLTGTFSQVYEEWKEIVDEVFLVLDDQRKNEIIEKTPSEEKEVFLQINKADRVLETTVICDISFENKIPSFNDVKKSVKKYNHNFEIYSDEKSVVARVLIWK